MNSLTRFVSTLALAAVASLPSALPAQSGARELPEEIQDIESVIIAPVGIESKGLSEALPSGAVTGVLRSLAKSRQQPKRFDLRASSEDVDKTLRELRSYIRQGLSAKQIAKKIDKKALLDELEDLDAIIVVSIFRIGNAPKDSKAKTNLQINGSIVRLDDFKTVTEATIKGEVHLKDYQKLVQRLWPKLLGVKERGYVGVNGNWIPFNILGQYSGPGYRVTQVVPGSPAHKAGLRFGDVIVGYIDDGFTECWPVIYDVSVCQAKLDKVLKDVGPGGNVNFATYRNPTGAMQGIWNSGSIVVKLGEQPAK